MPTKPEIVKTYLLKAVKERPIEEAYVNLGTLYSNNVKASGSIEPDAFDINHWQ